MEGNFCPKCGGRISAQETFCAQCGMPLNAPSGGIYTGTPAQPVYQAPVQHAWQPPAPPFAAPSAAQRTPAGVIVLFVISCVLLLGALAFGVWRFLLDKPVLSASSNNIAASPAISTMPAQSSQKPAVMPTLKPSATPTKKPAATPSPAPSAETEPLALLAEAALDSSDGILKRWEQPIKVEIKGSYTQEDYDLIVSQLDMINELGMVPQITVVESGGNCSINYVTTAEMKSLLEYYEDGYPTYFNYYWNDSYQLTKLVGAISTDSADIKTQTQRNSYTVKMIMRCLGFLGNNNHITNSALQKGSTLQALADNDFIFLSMLYSPAVKSGMNKAQVTAALTN